MQILYRWKEFSIISMNSASLPQNKALFGSNPFVKFLIAQKYVPMISALSSETEGSILKRELR